MGVTSFETLTEADPRKIELVTGRKYPFGNHIKESLLSLPPKIEMIVEETEGQRMGKPNLVITLTRVSEPVLSTKRNYADLVCKEYTLYYRCSYDLEFPICAVSIYTFSYSELAF